MEVIEEAKLRCKAVLQRIHQLHISKITSSCKSTLLRLLKSELNFLYRLSTSPSNSPSSSFSCNVGYFEAIVHILQQTYIMGVSRVCKPLPLSSTRSHGEKTVTQCEAVHVDIVCSLHNNPTWFIVSDRNPKYITWDGSGRNKGLKMRIDQIVHVAQYSLALKPVSIVLFFANGLDVTIREKLTTEFRFREYDLEFSNFEFVFSDALEGDWVAVLGKSYQGACTLIMDVDQGSKPCQSIECVADVSLRPVQVTEAYHELGLGASFYHLISVMKEWPLDAKDEQFCRSEDLLGDGEIVNFDTTALVAIISGISNGAAEKLLVESENELRQRFKNNTEFVISQALSEIKSPIHNELIPALSGKKGIACRSVLLEFMELVSMFGGPSEQMRANQLVKHLKESSDRGQRLVRTIQSGTVNQYLNIGQIYSGEGLRSGIVGTISRSALNSLLAVRLKTVGLGDDGKASWRSVPDTPSPRMMSLPVTRKLALKNKVVFGTGDHWGAPTLTANMAFVRAISQTGMSLFTIEHRPRALVGG